METYIYFGIAGLFLAGLGYLIWQQFTEVRRLNKFKEELDAAHKQTIDELMVKHTLEKKLRLGAEYGVGARHTNPTPSPEARAKMAEMWASQEARARMQDEMRASNEYARSCNQNTTHSSDGFGLLGGAAAGAAAFAAAEHWRHPMLDVPADPVARVLEKTEEVRGTDPSDYSERYFPASSPDVEAPSSSYDSGSSSSSDSSYSSSSDSSSSSSFDSGSSSSSFSDG